MAGIIRGGTGELALKDVPGVTPSDMIGRRGEKIARDYEAQFPNVVVVCDFELFSDQDIASMPKPQAAQALRDRANLERRREIAAAVPPPETPLRSGDPDRTREVLGRARRDMQNLDILHPQYEKLFTDFANQINLLEDACGEPRTKFVIATTAKAPKAKPLTDAERSMLASKVGAYQTAGVAGRMESVGTITDATLLRAILEVETETAIREEIVKKLFTMGKTA